eukprot:7385052-Prymnesium_polylepis.1
MVLALMLRSSMPADMGVKLLFATRRCKCHDARLVDFVRDGEASGGDFGAGTLGYAHQMSDDRRSHRDADTPPVSSRVASLDPPLNTPVGRSRQAITVPDTTVLARIRGPGMPADMVSREVADAAL